jgi:hypothetical protein
MLIRQNEYYNNSKIINTNYYNDDEEYGYFCDLDTNDNITIEKVNLNENSKNKIINNYVNRYYIYNFHDQKKDEDNNNRDYDDNEKYGHYYFVMNMAFITGTGFILLYLTIN